jgi:hypothetical protein
MPLDEVMVVFGGLVIVAWVLVKVLRKGEDDDALH